MYKNFLHIENVAEDGKSATMLLNKRIGNKYNEDGTIAEYGIQGDQFANEMLYLKACMNVQNIDVEINSIGGDVVEHGYNIVNAIFTHKANTKCTGMAASMAFSCLLAGEKRSIVDYGSLMSHQVSGDHENKILNIIQDSLKTIYMGRTKMNGDTCDNLFKGENWFSNSKKADYTLEDAVKMGIVDSIVNTGKKPKEITNAKKDLTSLAHIYNSYNENKTHMIKVSAVLGLKAEASEESIVAAIETIKVENTAKATELTTALAKVTELQTKIDGIENAAKDAKKAEAVKAVKAAITAGKIKAENEAEMTVLAETNLTAFNTLVGSAIDTKKAVVIFDKNVKAENVGKELKDFTAYEYAKQFPVENAAGVKATMEANNGNSDSWYSQFKKHK